MTGRSGFRFQHSLRVLRLLAISLVFNVGCSLNDDPGLLYLQRLAGALDQDTPTPLQSLTPLRSFPSGAQLAIERKARKLSVLDLMAVHRCQLGPLVAARNGSMGRVQGPSQRFLYDLALLQGLDACATKSPVLVEVRAERLAELPVSRFNALFAGSEWHDFATPPLSPAQQ